MEAAVTTTTRPRPALLVHALVPLPHPLLRTLAQVALGVAFLAALAQVRFAVGPVPITGQTLGVLLLAAAGGRRLGVATVVAYLGLGLAGLPLFAGGGAGLATLGGTTAGYLVGFIVAAVLVGALAERFGTARPLAVAGAMLLGTLVIYLFGVAWLSRFAPDLGTAVAWGVTPFVVGDLLKVLLATALLPVATRWLTPTR
jgi:biotin transport system substrate-specific component